MTSEEDSKSDQSVDDRFSKIKTIISEISINFKQRILITIMFSIIIPIIIYLIIENAFGKRIAHNITAVMIGIILIRSSYEFYILISKKLKVSGYQLYIFFISLFSLIFMILTYTVEQFNSDLVVRGFGFFTFGIIIPQLFFFYNKYRENEFSIEGEKDSIKVLYEKLVSSDLKQLAFFTKQKLAYIIAKTYVLFQERHKFLEESIEEQIKLQTQRKVEISSRYTNFLSLILTFSAFGFVIISFLWDSSIFDNQTIGEKTRIIILIISIIALMVSICILIVWLQLKISEPTVTAPSIYDKYPSEFLESDFSLIKAIKQLLEIESLERSNQYYRQWMNFLSILMLTHAVSLIVTIYQVTLFFS